MVTKDFKNIQKAIHNAIENPDLLIEAYTLAGHYSKKYKFCNKCIFIKELNKIKCPKN